MSVAVSVADIVSAIVGDSDPVGTTVCSADGVAVSLFDAVLDDDCVADTDPVPTLVVMPGSAAVAVADAVLDSVCVCVAIPDAVTFDVACGDAATLLEWVRRHGV